MEAHRSAPPRGARALTVESGPEEALRGRRPDDARSAQSGQERRTAALCGAPHAGRQRRARRGGRRMRPPS
eukprot:6707439-Alexandrium_andersonii.AAC.1